MRLYVERWRIKSRFHQVGKSYFKLQYLIYLSNLAYIDEEPEDENERLLEGGLVNRSPSRNNRNATNSRKGSNANAPEPNATKRKKEGEILKYFSYSYISR